MEPGRERGERGRGWDFGWRLWRRCSAAHWLSSAPKDRTGACGSWCRSRTIPSHEPGAQPARAGGRRSRRRALGLSPSADRATLGRALPDGVESGRSTRSGPPVRAARGAGGPVPGRGVGRRAVRGDQAPVPPDPRAADLRRRLDLPPGSQGRGGVGIRIEGLVGSRRGDGCAHGRQGHDGVRAARRAARHAALRARARGAVPDGLGATNRDRRAPLPLAAHGHGHTTRLRKSRPATGLRRQRAERWATSSRLRCASPAVGSCLPGFAGRPIQAGASKPVYATSQPTTRPLALWLLRFKTRRPPGGGFAQARGPSAPAVPGDPPDGGYRPRTATQAARRTV